MGRRFAITESGDMGLVPGQSQVGDLLVRVKSGKRCLVLRPVAFSTRDGGDDDDDEDDGVENGDESSDNGSKGKRDGADDV